MLPQLATFCASSWSHLHVYDGSTTKTERCQLPADRKLANKMVFPQSSK